MKNKLHIAFFHTSFSGAGGVEKFVSIWANHFTTLGHRVTLISLGSEQSFLFELSELVERIYLGFSDKRTRLLRYFIVRKLGKTLQQLGVDVVIGQNIKSSYILGWVAQRYAINAIGMEHLSYHCPVYNKKQLAMREKYFRHLKAFVALTPEDVPYYTKIGVSHPCCIFNPVAKPIDTGYATDSRLIISIGRQESQKNQAALLRAFALAHKEEPSLQLAIIGKDEGERPKLQRLASELDIDKDLAFYDFTPDVGAFYRRAALFTLTSDYEGLPLTLLEAKANGIPCISYDCPTGPKHIIRHEADGYLVDMGQETVFADRIIELMRNPSLRDQMSQACRHDIQERFSLPRLTEEWLQLFQIITTA